MNIRKNSESAKKPVQERGQKRRLLILEAARAKLMEQGVGGLVLRDIADEMGITHGNLQYYFKTKNDLVKAVFDREVKKYTTGLSEAVRSATSTKGKISALVDSGFDQLKTVETKLFITLIGIADQDKVFADILRAENEFYNQSLADEIVHIAPDLSIERRMHIAKIFRLILDGAAIDFIYNDPSDPKVSGLKGEIVVVLTRLLTIK
jgi:AcrR family transcriptional regulator